MWNRIAVLCIFALFLVACGEDSETNDPQLDGGGADSPDAQERDAEGDDDQDTSDPDPRSAELVRNFGSQTLAAGEESTPCVQWTLDNEEPIYLNTVTLGNDGGFHHSNWFVVPETRHQGEDGYFDCESRNFDEITAAVNGTVLFAQSTQAREEVQQFPDDVVIKVPPGHKVMGSLHLLNAAPREIETSLRMQLDLVHPGDVETVVTPFRLTYYGLDIPPESESRFEGECDMAQAYEELTGDPFDLKVYWVLPHYHELGNYFKLEIIGGERDGEELFELDGFNAEANGQLYVPPVDMSGADGFRFSCGFDNPRDESVGWGIGDQEMCVMLGFAESGAMLDASVEDNNVDETIDGVVYNSGDCQTSPIPKNEAQSMPSDDEIQNPMYIPPTDPDDVDVTPSPECEDTPEEATAGYDATLSEIRGQVFEVGCAFSACHNSSAPAAGLDLTADDLHGELLSHETSAPTDLALVEPGDAEASWLYQIMSQCEPRPGGMPMAKMPRNSPTLLDPALVATLRDWIDDGALDN